MSEKSDDTSKPMLRLLVSRGLTLKGVATRGVLSGLLPANRITLGGQAISLGGQVITLNPPVP